jgi:hypothetical protein
VATLADLAWVEVYFGEDAAAANNWVSALREIVPADSLTLNRLDGWLDLVAGRSERARGRLTSIADRDGLAAMGLVRLAAKDAGGQAEADELAARLLSTYRTGLVGAMVWAELHDNNRKPSQPAGAAEVKAVLDQFPRDWLQILEKPDAYYDLTADVDKVAHRYHEPMFGRVTLHNKTDYDLTIGTDGVIRPDLWVDARISGLLSQNYPGVAYDRVARYVVLPARQTLVQIIRIDQGLLGDTLDQNPSASAQVTANVLVNPAPTTGGVGPGPAGQRKTFSKNFVRSGFALSQPVARRKLTAQVQGGTPTERILGMDLMAGYVRLFAQQKNLDQAMRSLGGEFVGTISTSRSDPSKAVSAWATYLTARLNPDERANAMDALLADEGWPARLLAVLASAELGPERQVETVARLADSDPDATVKQFAAATADYLRSRPTTQPATADADAKPAEARESAPASQGRSVPTEGPALAPGSGDK